MADPSMARPHEGAGSPPTTSGRLEPVGFIGLGTMGGAIARNLARRGHRLIGYDTFPEALARAAQAGVQPADSLDDIISACSVVCTSLPMPADVERAYLGTDGLGIRLRPDSVAVDLSTIDPLTARRVADGMAGCGHAFLAAPVGKGPVQAEEGDIPVFVGGPAEVVDRVRPLLEGIGAPVLHMERVEHSTTFKIVSNLIGMAVVASTAEGLAVAERAGIPGENLLEALALTGADSYQLHARGPAMIANDYAPRFSVELARKDLRLGLDIAAEWGIPTPTLATVLQTYTAASANGWGGEDSAVVRRLADPAS